MAEGEQSAAPEEVEGASTDEGASGEGQFYDLNSVPEELREHVEPHLKDIQGRVTKSFQDAANYRKQWEPYEQLGVQDYDPEGLERLFEFADMAQDEDSFREWVSARAEELGLLEDSEDDFETEGIEDLSSERVQELVAEAVADKLNPVYETLQRQEQEQLEGQEFQKIQDQLEALQEEHGEFDRNAVLQLAYAYADEDADPIAKGFEDYRRLVTESEKGIFQKKTSQPAPAEGPGAASTSPEKVTTFEQAKELARTRLKESANA